MEITLVRAPHGALLPDSDADAEALRKIKAGTAVRCSITKIRNGAFHRKLMLLLRTCFDYWTEMVPPARYKGREVQPCFERFRRDLVCLAGYYEPVYALNGDVRLEPKSLSFANCSQEEAEAIYSAVIDAALKHVYRGSMKEGDLRAAVDRLVGFA